MAGSWKIDRVSEAISASGVLPCASIEVRWPVVVSSMAPRAMVREPSERISTISRATTGGSSWWVGVAGVGGITRRSSLIDEVCHGRVFREVAIV
jgi:hypothetical protein